MKGPSLSARVTPTEIAEEMEMSNYSYRVLSDMLESVNPSFLRDVIFELHRMEGHYELLIDDDDKERPKLSQHIVRIYHCREHETVDPVQRWGYVPADYGEAIHHYLACMPIGFRLDAFGYISRIVAKYAKK